jgi:hypothetical protein
MATVIDSLVLELGMDTRKFKEGERATLVGLDEFKKRLAETGEAAQEGVGKVSNLFMALRGGIFGVVAALGLGAIGSFIERVTHLDAATSRLARSLGVSTRELSVWQGVLKQVGGSAEQANTLFETLGDRLAAIRMNLSVPSGPFAFVMTRMGMDMRRASPGQVMERIPSFVQEQRQQGVPDANIRVMLQELGLQGAALFAAMAGDFATMRRTTEATGPLTEERGKAAEELVKKQATVETAFDRLASKTLPALDTAVNGLVAVVEKLMNMLGITTPSPGTTPAPTKAPGASGGTPWLGGPLFGDITGRGGQRAPGSSAEAAGNNPGKVPHGRFAIEHGATGHDHFGRAIFPTIEMGRAAATAFEELHGGKAPPFHGSDPQETFKNRWPVPGPGASLGGRGGGGTTVNVAAINVTSNKADPRAVAAEIPGALERRVAMVATFESGLG